MPIEIIVLSGGFRRDRRLADSPRRKRKGGSVRAIGILRTDAPWQGCAIPNENGRALPGRHGDYVQWPS